MKYTILLIFLASISWAALPDIITDPATRDAIEYLDAKLEDARDGVTGPRGYPGPKGDTGATGPAGATGSAATIAVGSSTTGGAGSSVYVNNSGSSSAAVFNFTIPKGDTGAQGIQGIQGVQGVQGIPGEVAYGSSGTFTGANTFSGSITSSGNNNWTGANTFTGNVTAYAVNASSVVSTPQLCLNGTCMTAITASGGDAGLASTQTFTGANTFTGAVIISSETGPNLIPAGAVISFNLSACPSGWYLADGTNGTPDLRGMFIRGLDSGRGLDPDANRVVGSTQTDTMQGHTHGGSNNYLKFDPGNPIQGTTPGYDNVTAGAATYGSKVKYYYDDDLNGTPRISTETRPENIAFIFCVKR